MAILFSSLPVTCWHLSAFLQRDGKLLGEFRREYCCLLDAIQRACWITTVILESVKAPLALRRCWRHRKGAVDLKGLFPSGDSPNDQAESRLRGEKAQVILWGQLPTHVQEAITTEGSPQWPQGQETPQTRGSLCYFLTAPSPSPCVCMHVCLCKEIINNEDVKGRNWLTFSKSFKKYFPMKSPGAFLFPS